MRKGIFLATGAYLSWGLFPIYFKSVADVAPMEILVQRIVWALPFLLIVMMIRAQWAWLGTTLTNPRILGGFFISAVLLAVHWFIYIWAVNNDRIVDSSLGYFVNPIVNVLLGFLLLRERLRPLQWAAIAIAAAGVLWLAILNGHMPWISLGLALTFGSYALIRKIAVLGALEGLTLESMMLFPFALAYLIYLSLHGECTFVSTWSIGGMTPWLLMAAGPITAIPLLLFTGGARRIPLSTLGLLQYFSPSIQLLLGIWIYHEPFNINRLIGFMLIWGALLLYSGESLWRSYRPRPGPGAPGLAD